MKFDDICNSILERVFHGTPHDVGVKFDISKIGTGEGAQVYGWGLYFAESPKVAEDYRGKLSGGDTYLRGKLAHKDGTSSLSLKFSSPDVVKTDADELAVDAMSRFHNVEDAVSYIETRTSAFGGPSPNVKKEAIDILKKGEVEFDSKGNLYEVEIDADVENDFLNWDKPLSEQSIKIQKKLKHINLEDRYEIGRDVSYNWNFYDKEKGYLYTDKPTFRTEEEAINFLKNPNGETLYYEINHDPKQASLSLLKMRIKGIKYLDQGSRESGGGTYNYVIFDPKIIKIVAKNGEFVMKGKKPENVEI